MKISAEDKKKIVCAVVQFLSSSSACTRNEVMNGTLLCYGFSKQEISNAHGASGKVNCIRSYIGTALTDLVSQRDVVINKDKHYSLAKEELVIVKEAECRSEILRLLGSKSVKKADLYLLLQKKFGTDKTASIKDDHSLRQIAGQIIAEEKNKGNIQEKDGVLSFVKKETPVRYVSTPLPEKEFVPLLLSRIHDLGGDFFEKFVANMLEKYYLINGRDVLSCEVIGGCDDGGVDIIIETEEELGFIDKIIIQVKNRKNIPVTEKEVREFYGAMNAFRGTRGIFVTTAAFHPSADKLLLSLPNCVGIDSEKLFSLIKQTAYGIHKTKSGFSFDNAIFVK